MNVSCASCETVYRVDPAKIPAGGVRARCSVCSGVMELGPTAEQAPGDAPAPSVPAAHRATTPQIRGAGPPPVQPAAPAPQPQEAGLAAPPPQPAAAPAAMPPAAPVAQPAAEPAPVAAPAPGPAPPPQPATRKRRITRPVSAPRLSGATVQPAPERPSAPVFHAAPGRPMPAPPVPQAAPQAAPEPPAAPSLGIAPAAPAAAPPPPAVEPQAPASGAPPPLTLEPQAPAHPAAPASPQPPVAAPAQPGAEAVPQPPTRPINPFLSQDPKQKARRLARALVSDMIVYQPEKRQQAMAQGNLKEVFDEEIKKSWDEYVEQVGSEVAESTTFFTEALNEILAGGQQVF